MKEMYIKNTTDVDLNKSTDNINLIRRNNIKSNKTKSKEEEKYDTKIK